MAKHTIIQLVWFPFMERDYERFGLGQWREHGFDIRVFDFTQVCHPSTQGKTPALPDIMSAEFIHKISSLDQFVSLLDALGDRGATVIVNTVKFQETVLPYMQEFRARNFRIIVANVSTFLPVHKYGLKAQLRDDPKRVLKKLFSPKTVLKKVKQRVMRYSGSRGTTTSLFYPDIIFLSCEAERRMYSELIDLTRVRLIANHTNDVDLFLSAKRTMEAKQKFCLFLDEAMHTNHRKQLVGDRVSPVDIDDYTFRLRKFFDLVEEQTGLPVAVALHPRAEYDDIKTCFGNRKVVKGATAELAAQSKFVMLHRSSSLSYAVLNKIPALFFVTDELCDPSKTVVYAETRTLAEELGRPVVNIDDPKQLASLDFNDLSLDQGLYDRYFKNYLSFEETPEKTIWDNVYQGTFGMAAEQ